MRTKSVLFKMANFVVVFCFLFSNSVFAAGFVNADKMASTTRAAGVAETPNAGRLGAALGVLRDVKGLGVTSLADVFKPEVFGTLREKNVPFYVTPEGVRYVFAEGLLLRDAPRGEDVRDEFGIAGEFPLVEERDWIEGRKMGVCERTPETEAQITAVLAKMGVVPKASLIGKKVEAGAKYESIAQVTVTIDKGEVRLGDIVVKEGMAGTGHAKYNAIGVNIQQLGGVLKTLVGNLGIGVLGVVDVIRFADNIHVERLAGQAGLVPYAMMEVDPDTGERILLLDVDALLDGALLTANLEHELRHSIISILPNVPSGLEELTAIYASLKFALDNSLSINPQFVAALPDGLSYLKALNALRAQTEINDSVILAVAIEHMRSMPYYAEVLKPENLTPELRSILDTWGTSVGTEHARLIAEARTEVDHVLLRYQAAVNVFNGIEQAKREAVIGQVKGVTSAETKARGDLGKTLDRAIKKAEMLASSIPLRSMGLAEILVTAPSVEQGKTGKYIRIYVEDLQGNSKLNPDDNVLKWLQGLLKGQTKSPFQFCRFNDKGEVVVLEPSDQYLKDNKLVQASVPQGIKAEDIIDTRDILHVLRNNNQLSRDSMNLPLIFSITSVYLASQVVLVGGDISRIKAKDPLVYNTLMSIYSALFGDGFTEDILRQIIFGTWPELLRVSVDIEAVLRVAMPKLDSAA